MNEHLTRDKKSGALISNDLSLYNNRKKEIREIYEKKKNTVEIILMKRRILKLEKLVEQLSKDRT